MLNQQQLRNDLTRRKVELEAELVNIKLRIEQIDNEVKE